MASRRGNRVTTHTHGEEQLWVILGVDRNETVVPLNRSDRARESVLDVPENGATQVDVMLDQAHSTVSWPALFVVVSNQADQREARINREIGNAPG